MNKDDPDKLTDEEKIMCGLDAIKTFFDSLGSTDIYKIILLEELFKMIVGEED